MSEATTKQAKVKPLKKAEKKPVVVPPIIDRLITQQEFAEAIACHPREFVRKRNMGKIPPPDSPPGEHPKWRASTVNKFIEDTYSHGQRVSTTG